MKNVKIINCVGNHTINVFEGATFDPTCRKYRGGVKVAEIPFSGRMFSARTVDADAAPLVMDGVQIPTITRRFDGVEAVPDDGNMYVVSAMYVAACREAGFPTDRLLTVGNPVVDDGGRVIGCTCLIRN